MNLIPLFSIILIIKALAQGLENLQGFSGNIQETYDRTFSIEREDELGNRVSFDLLPSGSQIPLTNDNSHLFVNCYVDFILNTSCSKQFDAFKDGFDQVMEGTAILVNYCLRSTEQLDGAFV